MSSSDRHTVQLQVPSAATACVIHTMASNNYLERYNINAGEFLEQSSFIASNTQRLDNNVNDNSYIVQDQNYNINMAFCMSPTMPVNKTTSVTPNGSHGKNFNNGFVHQRKNQWKNSRTFDSCSYNGDAKDQVGKEGNGHHIRYNSNGYNANGCDSNLSNKISVLDNNTNTFPLSHHNGTNGFNRTRHYSQNSRRMRRYNNNHSDDILKRVFGLMERFKSKAIHFRISPTFPILGKKDITKLDQAIWDVFTANVQTEDTYIKKLDLWQKVFIHITKLFDRYALFMVGSTMCGLATQNSDIDMCLLLRTFTNEPRVDAVHCLEVVRNSLTNCDFVQSVDLIQAKVPILKFIGLDHGFAVDLNCNNAVGIRNTHLLYCYVQLDWRVRPLIVTVKLWAQANSINDAKHSTISSYSLALMVIHYLQCGTSPPLLPNLHNMYPEKFKPEREIHDIDIQEKIPKCNSYNHQTLGELLMGFLNYYANFKFDTDAISVRLAARVSIDECRFARAQKNDPHQWKYLCIEEPFDLTNTARSVYDLAIFRRIQHVFQNSCLQLWDTRDLSSILKTEENQR